MIEAGKLFHSCSTTHSSQFLTISFVMVIMKIKKKKKKMLFQVIYSLSDVCLCFPNKSCVTVRWAGEQSPCAKLFESSGTEAGNEQIKQFWKGNDSVHNQIYLRSPLSKIDVLSLLLISILFATTQINNWSGISRSASFFLIACLCPCLYVLSISIFIFYFTYLLIFFQVT